MEKADNTIRKGECAMSDQEFTGYLKNKHHLGGHIMKRYVAPQGQIPLEELYQQYGAKHGFSRDESFLTWLREVKLKDTERWVIVEDKEDFSDLLKEKEELEAEGVLDKRPADMQISEIADLSVRKAREALPLISDQRIIKYALREASQRPNKDSLCNLLRKRLLELQANGV